MDRPTRIDNNNNDRVDTQTPPDQVPSPLGEGSGFSTEMHQTQGSIEAPLVPTTRIKRMARRGLGVSMRVLESLLRSTIRVEGMHNIHDGPVLFVANHFTRFETFILPYIIDHYAGRNVHSLAFNKLFKGHFGDFLMSIGARPTGDPAVKHAMVEELMTGRHDWLIYPEGSMIKNKKTWANGHFEIECPDRTGMPHTGSAIIALKAMIYKQLYRQAVRQNDRELMARYEKRYHLSGPQDVDGPDLQIIPINISYYPIRPGRNLLYKMAHWLVKQMPTFLEEELLIEGNLLLSETDMSVYFGKPLKVDHYLNLLMPTLQRPLPFVDQLRQANKIMGALKNRLTRRMMSDIYTRLTINFDHLFCAGLRYLDSDCIKREDFHQSIYLAAREIQHGGQRLSHPSISRELVDVVCGAPYKPLVSVVQLAEDEAIITQQDDHYYVHQSALKQEHSFHDIRLKNTVAVIANEVEPLRQLVHLIKNVVNLPSTTRRKQIACLLRNEDIADFENERRGSAASPDLKDEHIGKPFFLHDDSHSVGIVLSHGYLSSPHEVRHLADHLFRLGFSVYALRLPGHGTAPEQLDHVTCDDWLRAYRRACAIIRTSCRHVILGGFSAGGTVALIEAARQTDALGVFSINPCLKLMDLSSHLVPAVTRWNGWMNSIHLAGARFDHVTNHAENPITNYAVNYLHGVHELERLMGMGHELLHQVRIPSLTIQGDHDPVVHPDGGRIAHQRISAEDKTLAMMAFDRHGIINGDGSEVVLQRIGEFVQHLSGHIHPIHRRRSDRTTTITRRHAG